MRLIDADYLDELITQLIKEGRNITRNDYKMIDNVLCEFPTADVVEKERYDRLLENSTIIADALSKYQAADMVEVVRCKDCKHRPTGTGVNHDLEFPDDECPCQCEDYWYSWMPPDDWFCPNGERS